MQKKSASIIRVVALFAVCGLLLGTGTVFAATQDEDPGFSVGSPATLGVGPASDSGTDAFIQSLAEVTGQASCTSGCCWATGCNVTCSESSCTGSCGDETATYICSPQLAN